MYGLVLTPEPFFINTVWLEKVGKEMPTTVEEFKDVLMAFRDAGDLNGNGLADEAWEGYLQNLKNAGLDQLLSVYESAYARYLENIAE